MTITTGADSNLFPVFFITKEPNSFLFCAINRLSVALGMAKCGKDNTISHKKPSTVPSEKKTTLRPFVLTDQNEPLLTVTFSAAVLRDL